MGEGLSNPLYPYFLPQHNNTESNNLGNNSNEKLGDFDLLQEYGLDFKKFNLSNGSASTKKSVTCNDDITESNDGVDNAFASTFNSTTSAKSQNHWTKFE